MYQKIKMNSRSTEPAPQRNIGSSELGRQLRMLGLILDSPDAESGILLVPPFDLRQSEVTA
jgi:hypothetical protein